MYQDTPESILETPEESFERILSCPSTLTRKYPSHLVSSTSKKSSSNINSDRPFASLTQMSKNSGESLINPNMVQIFYCLSSIIQAQIADDCERYDESINNEEPGFFLYPIFDISFPSLSPEDGGEQINPEIITNNLENILNHEVTDEELKNKIDQKRVPSLMSIFRFIAYLYRGAEYSPECNIMALVYINRLTSMSQLLLTYQNWRSVWLVVIMLAQKVWDDKPLRTSGFARLLPDIELKNLRELEYETLNMLKYITGVKPSLYAKYYFELRQLYSDILGTNPFCGEWALEPLSNYLTSKLDMKNQKIEENRLKMLHQYKSSAKDTKDYDSDLKSDKKTSISPPLSTSSSHKGYYQDDTKSDEKLSRGNRWDHDSDH